MQIKHYPLKDLLLELEDHFANPREFVDMREVRELADSIAETGLQYPLQVWSTDGKLVVVDGGRRLRALEILHKEKRANGLTSKVPVVLVAAKTPIEAREAALVANLQRVELTSYEMAKEIHALKEAGLSQSDIATKLSKSQSWVSRQLKAFTTVAPGVRTAWKARKLPDDDVHTLSQLPEPEQERRLEKLLEHRAAAQTAKPGQVAKAKAKARAAAKGQDRPDPKAVRPDAKLIRSYAELCGNAPKTNKYVAGMHDAFRFMLGELGFDEWSKDFTEFANKEGFGAKKALTA